MARDPIRFMHVIATVDTKLRIGASPEQRGGVTIGIMKSEENHVSYRFAVAICSGQDSYSKKRGRQIVRGRMACSRLTGRVGRMRGSVHAEGFDDAFLVAIEWIREAIFNSHIVLRPEYHELFHEALRCRAYALVADKNKRELEGGRLC